MKGIEGIEPTVQCFFGIWSFRFEKIFGVGVSEVISLFHFTMLKPESITGGSLVVEHPFEASASLHPPSKCYKIVTIFNNFVTINCFSMINKNNKNCTKQDNLFCAN